MGRCLPKEGLCLSMALPGTRHAGTSCLTDRPTACRPTDRPPASPPSPSFPLPLPGTAYYRGMRAHAALLACLRASLAVGGASPPEEPESQARLALLLAGHDVTATALARTFLHLHQHPEIATRLYSEQVHSACARACHLVQSCFGIQGSVCFAMTERQHEAERHSLPRTPISPAFPPCPTPPPLRQDAVLAAHGPHITTAVLTAMPYAAAVAPEALLSTPICGAFPRVVLQVGMHMSGKSRGQPDDAGLSACMPPAYFRHS